MKKIKLFVDLERYMEDLEQLLPSEEEFLKNKGAQYSVSMIVMNIVTTCIDIGSEVVSIKQLGYASHYREVFSLLEKAGYISVTLSKRMQDFVGLRNLLAHEYGEVRFELMYDQISDIKSVEEFAAKMVNFF